MNRGPVWVYVLERRRAIEVWNALMGDPDPAIARTTSPNSLRALYGKSKIQNAVMGSPDIELAEIQIASLFVSSHLGSSLLMPCNLLQYCKFCMSSKVAYGTYRPMKKFSRRSN